MIPRGVVSKNMESAPTAFAILDILGYGGLMRRQPDEVLSLVQELLQTSVRNRMVQRDLDRFAQFSGTARAPVIEYLQFSDTLLIWLRSDPLAPKLLQTPAQIVQSVCYASALTLGSFIATGIPLRGAIGFGSTFVSRVPLFFTGNELYETAKLEREQAWAGAALHDSAANVLTFGKERNMSFVVEYPVPMTEDSVRSPSLAVDWVSCLSSFPPIVPPWDHMFTAEDAKVRRKGKETQYFFETVESQHRTFPILLTQQSIAAMRERLVRLLRCG